MILRNVAIRHGRKVVRAPLCISVARAFNTNPLKITPETQAIEQPIHTFPSEACSIETSTNQLPFNTSFAQQSGEAEPSDENRDTFAFKRHLKKRTAKLGSIVAKHYIPESLVLNPPKPEDVTLELLLASQSHLGHSTSRWNPANQRYIFGIRQGVHIISLEETAAHLRRAAKVVEGVAYHGGLILFVGTRAGQSSCVVKAAQLAKGCHLFEKWIPGSITNGDQILSKCGIKVVDENDLEISSGFESKIDGWQALKPDLVVCMNPLENYILLHECGLNNIPTIGVIDTDADPTWVTYPIPANDDSLRCIQVIAGVLGRAGEEGQRSRLQAAVAGEVTWRPPTGLGKPEMNTPVEGSARRLKTALEPEIEKYTPRTRSRRGAIGDDDEL